MHRKSIFSKIVLPRNHSYTITFIVRSKNVYNIFFIVDLVFLKLDVLMDIIQNGSNNNNS